MAQRPDQRSSPAGDTRAGVIDDPARTQLARRLTGTNTDRDRLDRFTALAARLVGARSAQVSIIADRQVVLAGVGAGQSLVGGESPAEESLCTVTVRRAEPLTVSDAPTDPAVNQLPPVTSGAVGAYLGTPLDVGGHLVGALCVYDDAPREWTAQDTAILVVLAEAVAAELQSAALEATYEEDREVWQLAVDAAGVGAFDWDLRTGELRWDDRLLDIFGTSRAEFGGSIEAFTALVHPDDRERVAAALAESLDQCSVLRAEYRIVLSDGTTRWVTARGRAFADETGRAARLFGAAFDSTAVQQSETRVARILEAMPSAFFHLDREWRFTYANAEAKRLLAGVSEDVVGHDIWDLFPEATGTDFEQSYRRAMSTGSPVSFEAYYPPPLDSWYEVRAWPSPDGLSVYFQDITARRKAEDELAVVTERSALLAEVTASLTATVHTVEAVGRLAQMLVPRMGDWCLVSLIDDPDPFARRDWRRHVRDIGSWHGQSELRPLLERYSRVRIPALGDGSYLARAIRDSSAIVLTDDATDAIAGYLEDGEAQDLYRRLAPAHVVILPIHGRGRSVGALTLARNAGQPPFTTEEVDTLGEVAARAGLALDNTMLFGRQRDLAEGLQRSLLIPPPVVDGLDIAVRYVPAAEMAQVGGDWYDAFLTSDGLMLVIGDVMGHDTVAAAAMGQLNAILRGIAVTTGDGPAGVLARLDEAMTVLGIDSIASAVVARLGGPSVHEVHDLRLTWSNAGHPPPLTAWVDAEGQVQLELLHAAEADTLLGIGSGRERAESTSPLAPGGLLVLYTDGLVERRDQALDAGLDALRTVMADLVRSDLCPEQIADELLRRMLPDNPEDDAALVVVRRQVTG